MQVAVRPPHGDLYHLVQLPERDVRRHRYTPPDRRLAVAERDAKRVDVAAHTVILSDSPVFHQTAHDGMAMLRAQCHLSQHNRFESLLALLPVRHAPAQQSVEGRAVIMHPQVAELMHDDILNAVQRSLHQVSVQGDRTSA